MNPEDTPPFIDYFADLADPRIDDRCDHKLIDILFVAVCAVIRGADGFTGMEEFGLSKETGRGSFSDCLMASRHTIPSGRCLLGSSPVSFSGAS